VEKIKELVNSSLTKCVVSIGIGILLLIKKDSIGIGILLLIKKDIMYSGIAFGIGIREFFLAFKQDCPAKCKKDCCIK